MVGAMGWKSDAKIAMGDHSEVGRMPMATGEVWRASVVGSHAGTELAVNTWHFRMLTSADPVATIGLYLKTYWIDTMKTKWSNSFRIDEIDFLRVNASPPISDRYTTAMPIAGQLAQEETAHQVAAVATIRTQYAGRSYRGRHYIPALGETSWTAGLLDTTVRNAIQTYYDDIVAAVGASGANSDIRWVVWSHKLLTSTDVKDVIVRSVPGVVRRRRVGVGV